MSTRDDDHELGAGYDLGAETQEEAADFAEVAAILGMSTEPVQPPASLKADLMSKLAGTPQESSTPETAGPMPAPRAGAVEKQARRHWFSRPAFVIAAAAAAAVLVFGGSIFALQSAHERPGTHQEASAYSQIVAAADSERTSVKIPVGGTATLVWSITLGKSAITVHGLAAAPSGKTYELWYLRDNKAIPAGTMDVTGSGATTHVLAGAMAAGDTVAVTVEPHGGSKQPTSVPILAIHS